MRKGGVAVETKRNRPFAQLFTGASEALWLLFLFLDLTGIADSTYVKFAAICLCCLFALTGARSLDARLVAVALCFTVGADWFLLVRNTHYLLGVGLFTVVQLLYAARLYLLRGRRLCPWGLALRGLGLAAGLIAARFDPLTGASLFYFCSLATNALEAAALGTQERTFAWGLLLFVCCDLCVGGWNLGLLPGFTRVGMWLFYLPSQVLIVLSAHPKGT
jgi:hypothetical protein